MYQYIFIVIERMHVALFQPIISRQKPTTGCGACGFVKEGIYIFALHSMAGIHSTKNMPTKLRQIMIKRVMEKRACEH